MLGHLHAVASSVVHLVAHDRSHARVGVAERSIQLRSTWVVFSYPDDKQAPACLLCEVFASLDQRGSYSSSAMRVRDLKTGDLHSVWERFT